MSDSSAAQASPERQTLTRTAIIIGSFLALLLCLIPLVGVIAPRILGIAPAVAGIVFLSLVRFTTGEWPRLNKFYVSLAFLVTGLAAISSLWAIDQSFAIERTLKLAPILFGGCALAALLVHPRGLLPEWFCKAFPIVFGVAGLYCLEELITRGFIHHIWRGTEVHPFNVSMVNRAVMAWVLLLLPTLVLLNLSSFTTKVRRLLAVLLLVIAGAILVLTDSQTAHLAVLVIALCWAAFPLIKRLGWPPLAAVVSAGILSMPWLVQFLYNHLAASVSDAPWLKQAFAANRLEIWDMIARKALENPLYGYGIEATRHIEKFETQLLYADHDHVLHPHNAVLQIWMEFGALGALVLCAICAYMLRSFAQMTSDSHRLCLAVFMSVLAVSMTSYGLWQGWWIGLFTFIAALCARAVMKRRA